MSAGPLRYGPVSERESDFAESCRRALAADSDGISAGAKDGWFGVGTAEDHGGAGGSMADVAVMAEEIGAAHAASLAGWQAGVVAPVLSCGDQKAGALLERICAGAACVAIPVTPMTAASALAGEGALTGELIALGTPDCTHIPVPCALAGVPSIAFFSTDHPKVRLRALDLVDVTRPALAVEVQGAPAGEADAVVSGGALLDDWVVRSSLVAALDSAGLARAVLERTIDYAQTRVQFGRPIGSFQAYKHRCATMFIKHKLAQSLAFRAAKSADTADGRLMALAAGKLTTDYATFIAGEAVQLHGGMGYTWEAGIHHYLKRARTNEVLARSGDHGPGLLLREYRSSREAS
jgi:alkylation response protein AidB-like acyl-CoA dehydrogenase